MGNASKSESRPDMRRYHSHFSRREAEIWPLVGQVEPQQEVFADPPISVGGGLFDLAPDSAWRCRTTCSATRRLLVWRGALRWLWLFSPRRTCLRSGWLVTL